MSSSRRGRDLAAEIKVAVGDQNLKDALFHAVSGVNEKRREVIGRFPGYEQACEAARGIKEEAIADLPAIIEQLTKSVKQQGGHLHRAENG